MESQSLDEGITLQLQTPDGTEQSPCDSDVFGMADAPASSRRWYEVSMACLVILWFP